MRSSRVSYIVLVYGANILIGTLLATTLSEYLGSVWSRAITFLNYQSEILWLVPHL